MAEIVEDALNFEENAIIEAGVGTGKSLAYAIPAILSKKRVVISTATIALQSQLVNKDLPFLKEELGKVGIDVNYAVVKGKSNYICPLAVNGVVQDKKSPLKITKQLQEFSLRVLQGEDSGDKESLHSVPGYWNRISAENCIGEYCKDYHTCGYIAHQNQVKVANLVVCNHAILGADLSLGRKVSKLQLLTPTSPDKYTHPILYDFHALVIDEAHKAVDYIRDSFASELTVEEIEHIINEVSKYAPDAFNGAVANELLQSMKSLFSILPEIGRTGYTQIEPKDYNNNYIGHVRSVKECINKFIAPITEVYRQLIGKWHGNSQSIKSQEFIQLSNIVRKLNTQLQTLDELVPMMFRITETDTSLNQLTSIEENRVIYVTEEDHKKKIVISPISIGPILAGRLYNYIKTVVATSGTLTINGKFDTIKGDLGLVTKPEYELRVQSPYDYDHNAVLYLSKAVPEAPSMDSGNSLTEYAAAVASEVRKLYSITDGRMFVLFSSRAELESVKPLLQDLHLLTQDYKTPSTTLVKQFREAAKEGKKPVLLGLKTFWEGVSIEGDDLSCIVIVKLPFPPQNDPVYQAQQKNAGNDAFVLFTLPPMIRDVQQGAGRLIRTADDIGIIAILDKRMHTKNYGQMVVNSLPFKQRSTNLNSVGLWYKKRYTQKVGS